jgi:hypothetical protein
MQQISRPKRGPKLEKPPKWLGSNVPMHLRKSISRDALPGVNADFFDSAYWLENPDTGLISLSLTSWVQAFMAIDKTGDDVELLILLRRERDLSRDVRNYLADLIERYSLKPKTGVAHEAKGDARAGDALDASSLAAWRTGSDEIDQQPDIGKRLLAESLRSTLDLPPLIRTRLISLFERYRLAKPPHRPRTPAYDRTDTEGILELATRRARELVKVGKTVEDSVGEAAKAHAIPEEVLMLHYSGKRGSSQRMRRRRPSPNR